MTRWALVGACSVFLVGCGAVYQRYTVEPISKEPATPQASPDVGNWFLREVYNPDESSRKEYAYELIYCPTDRGDFSKCRSAVVWARGGKGGLGPQSNAPESLVVDPPRSRAPRREVQPAPVATASPATTAFTPAPPPSPPSAPPSMKSVVTAGTDYESLSADALARMRSWTGRFVEVTTKTGKTISGVIRYVRAEGVGVERNGETSIVEWTDVQSVAIAREAE